MRLLAILAVGAILWVLFISMLGGSPAAWLMVLALPASIGLASLIVDWIDRRIP